MLLEKQLHQNNSMIETLIWTSWWKWT